MLLERCGGMHVKSFLQSIRYLRTRSGWNVARGADCEDQHMITEANQPPDRLMRPHVASASAFPELADTS